MIRPITRSKRRLSFFVGLFFGVLITIFMKRFPPCKNILFKNGCNGCVSVSKPRQDIYIGILSSKEFLDRRVKFIQESWGADARPHLHFYMNYSSSPKLPVVRLEGVRDDEYPPRKKVFKMLKHWCSNLVDKYNWFVRADDDAYIKIDGLKKFLHNLDSEKKWYIGQGGEGRGAKRGKIGFPNGYYYCMGGPGMIFSRGLLKNICPHLDDCQYLNVTEHEDIEVGRCVLRKAGISCTSNYEMANLFYAHYMEHNQVFRAKMEGSIAKSILRALTIHPLKEAAYSFRIHQYILNSKAQKLSSKIVKLRSEEKFSGSFKDEKKKLWNNDKPWTNIWKGYRHYQTTFEDQRKRLLGVRRSKVRDAALKSLLFLRNNQDKPVKYLRSVYTNLRPNFGIGYELHVRLQGDKFANVGGIEKFGSLISTEVNLKEKDPLTIIVPFSGRYEALKKFLINWKRLSAIDGNAKLLIARSESSKEIPTEEPLNDLKNQPNIKILTNYGNFSRGILLHHAIRNSSENGIVCFIDVDIKLGNNSLSKIRRNTIKNKRAFLPIMFSEFDPRFSNNSSENFNENSGYWRESSFGQLCLYKDDYLRSGGFPQNIKGWGREDIELGDRLIFKANLDLFRSADPDFIHKYHAINCTVQNKKQRKMCDAVRSKTFASRKRLAFYVDTVLGIEKTMNEDFRDHNLSYDM